MNAKETYQSLNTLLDSNYLSRSELIKKANISDLEFENLLSCNLDCISARVIMSVASALNISADTLLSVLSEKADEKLISPIYSDPDKQFVKIKRYDVLFDDKDSNKISFIEHRYDREILVSGCYCKKMGINSPENLKCFKISGDFMSPLICNNDYVIVECNAQLPIIDGQIYAFADKDHGIMVRRFISPLHGGLILRSDNPSVDDVFLSKDEMKSIFIIGKVIERSGCVLE
ncbi:helix-turn-helix transcriptional regulator [Succinivibrio sp.]|uniref:S24 family peptidase n=1 Tax=Succinivibrio sp. TaxID=2053619 RepID=UPI003865970E